ncbi:unnamed protein product, partial [Rotaria sp. Silwood1]
MEYYSDKIQLCLQADSNISVSIIIHHLITRLTQSLIPHVIRRHPSTLTDFLTIAQEEEQIQFTLNDLSRASINSPDNYPNNNDPIDPSVMVVTPPLNTEKRPSYYQQPSLFLPSRLHDQHQFIFNKRLQEIKPEQVILYIPLSISTISKKEQDNEHKQSDLFKDNENTQSDLCNDNENHPLDILNDDQIESFPNLENKFLHEDEQAETDHSNELKQQGACSSTDSLTADDTLINTVVPRDVQYLWSDKYRPHKPRVFNKVYAGYDWDQFNKKHYDMDTPTPYEDIAFTI